MYIICFSFLFLFQGLSDSTHTVVKQSLASIENAFCFLLAHSSIHIKNNRHNERAFIECGNILLDFDNHFHITIENIIDELLLVYENKYWVVQCKYCDLISKLDFDRIKLVIGHDQAQLYEVNKF